MRSKLAEQMKEEEIEICKRMTPVERLEAFVRLSKAHAELYYAGVRAREKKKQDIQKE